MKVKEKLKFSIILIKPSHYDDDGYVIQWLRSSVPSNSLACLYGLMLDCAKHKVLGDHVELNIHAFDETNTHIDTKKIISLTENFDDCLVLLVGVQSNQFPRALDIAKPLRQKNIKTIIGGFHVSGTMALFKEPDAYMQKALDLGITFFSGEAEGRLPQMLTDAFFDGLQPVYNFMSNLPNFENTPTPILPSERVRLTMGLTTSFDAGRGCPFTCSFCTIINVQGRQSRYRSTEAIEEIIRVNLAQGLTSFFITDDNFARNKNWENILDLIINMREVEGLKITLMIQVDTLSYKLKNFVEKSKRAGLKRVFIGLESINSDSLLGTSKRQNKVSDYKNMFMAWKQAGIITYCGYIIGFPNETPESVLRDIETIKQEFPLDLLEFFYLTPLPGSMDHKGLLEAGVAMDEDLNKYDLNHVVTAHNTMSKREWEETYCKAWKSYYSVEHAETIIRRAVGSGINLGNLIFLFTWFSGCIDIEKIHPLEGGIMRMKYRKTRRLDLPLENPLIFYPKYFLGTFWKQIRWLSLYIKLILIKRKVCKQQHSA